MYWGTGRECRYSGARRGIGSIRGYWKLLGVLRVLEAVMGASGDDGGVRNVLGLAGSVGTQEPEGV